MKRKYADVSEAVLAFSRAELERRYQYDNVRRFKEFKGIRPEVVEIFLEFVLLRVYPEGEDRAVIDCAFGHLESLLRSPRKMATLGKVVLSAVLRLGRRLPAAMAAGEQVIHAFSCASKVETMLCEAVVERKIAWKTGIDPEVMPRLFSELPEKPFQALITALVQLLELAGNRETMETGLDLLERISQAMTHSPNHWTDGDRQGMALARETLTEAIALFSHLNDRDIPRFINGVKAVEEDWYRSMCSAE